MKRLEHCFKITVPEGHSNPGHSELPTRPGRRRAGRKSETRAIWKIDYYASAATTYAGVEPNDLVIWSALESGQRTSAWQHT